MTTGIIFFINNSGDRIPIAIRPCPAFAVPYAPPISKVFTSIVMVIRKINVCQDTYMLKISSEIEIVKYEKRKDFMSFV